MTHCVRIQGVGVLAQTNACPVDTSAVDELVWTAATFMKGELCTVLVFLLHVCQMIQIIKLILKDDQSK